MDKVRLSSEEIDDLKLMVASPGFDALMRILDATVTRHERAVLNYNLETGDERKLAILKAISEGATKVSTHLKREIARYTRLAS